MAKVKITNQKNVLKKMTRDSKRKLSDAMIKNEAKIVDEIASTILSGQSPVKGKTFKIYSKPYADRWKGGARKPVNMMLTGEMLESLNIKKLSGDRGISINFTSEIAKFHDKLGAGASKVIRRLLPDAAKGERFRDNIAKLIKRVLLKGFGS